MHFQYGTWSHIRNNSVKEIDEEKNNRTGRIRIGCNKVIIRSVERGKYSETVQGTGQVPDFRKASLRVRPYKKEMLLESREFILTGFF